MWYAHELQAVGRLLGDTVESPSLEFGCLDGVNTFLLLGGEFDFAFDLYKNVNVRPDHLATTHDYFDAADVLPGAADLQVRPANGFDYALDYKATHLRKAAALGLYKQTILQGLDDPVSSLEAESLATIWAPMLFWVERTRITTVLRDFHRVLRTGGRIVTMLPDACIGAHLIQARGAVAGADDAWIREIDVGKHANFTRNSRSFQEWEDVFGQAGLVVTSHARFAPPLIVRIYDIGFRPMFPVFMKMYDALRQCSSAALLDVKRHWVETCGHFLKPLCEDSAADSALSEMTWHVFELRRRP